MEVCWGRLVRGESGADKRIARKGMKRCRREPVPRELFAARARFGAELLVADGPTLKSKCGLLHGKEAVCARSFDDERQESTIRVVATGRNKSERTGRTRTDGGPGSDRGNWKETQRPGSASEGKTEENGVSAEEDGDLEGRRYDRKRTGLKTGQYERKRRWCCCVWR